ncbi:hypothetical protein Trydic_g22109 [Trypoxylus dichotomus]
MKHASELYQNIRGITVNLEHECGKLKEQLGTEPDGFYKGDAGGESWFYGNDPETNTNCYNRRAHLHLGQSSSGYK